ncbi:hypothetical protein [Marinobacterium rhizophilum]|uniref:hypothetical protein n=1 Tax=Marinobacterium rhizophilum TaxID=420402 RepID=UPI00039DF966|nr:hypothetical protein [Marinobacterium rhizophilum]
MVDQLKINVSNNDSLNESNMSHYILTGSRNLLRILDVGLIVPELVATTIDGNIFKISPSELSSIKNIDGYPKVPVLLEINGNTCEDNYLPVSSIKAVHFNNSEAVHDFTSRGFENLPLGLFSILASPDLFIDGYSLSKPVRLSKIDREGLKERYRHIDVYAGGVFWLISNVSTVAKLKDLFERLSKIVKPDQICELLLDESIGMSGGSESDYSYAAYNSYLNLLGEHDLDEGWVRLDLITELESRLTEDTKSSEVIRGWFDYSKKVISHERELQKLTDENQIILRAILLHLLNPDLVSLNRVVESPLKHGALVVKLAKLLAATRIGFAPLTAKDKEEAPGSYFLISDLMAAVLNEARLDSSCLELNYIDDVEKPFCQVGWRGFSIANIAIDESKFNAEEIEESVDEYKPGRASIEDFVLAAKSLEKFEEPIYSQEGINLVLKKQFAQGLPRKCIFELRQVNHSGNWMFSTRLLDLSLKSHTAKLTMKRLQAVLIYQTSQSSNFRFELHHKVSFNACVEVGSKEQAITALIDDAISKLVASHLWMKKTL